MQTIKSKGLCVGSLFKVIFVGMFIPIFILGTLCGIAALLGHDTVTLNGAYVHGLEGVIVGVGIGVVLPVIMAFFLTIVMAPSTWLWTRIKPYTLNVKE
jgi:hypothetical protein